jgi:hypothetical protein
MDSARESAAGVDGPSEFERLSATHLAHTKEIDTLRQAYLYKIPKAETTISLQGYR